MTPLNFQDIRHVSLRKAFQGLMLAIMNGIFGGGDLAVAAQADKFKLSATNYRIDGVAYTKAAQDNIASPASTSAGQYRKDLISINAAGTVTVTPGVVAATLLAAQPPALPASSIPLGWIEVPPAFVGGTTAVTAGMLFKWQHSVDLLAEVPEVVA